MAKWANDLVMDEALNFITNADFMFICSAQPTTYEEASATYCLATHAMTAASFGDAENGDTNGRKMTIEAAPGITVDVSGTATHIALGIAGPPSTILVYVTTCTSQVLTALNVVDIPAWDITFSDPV